jgi:C_GCAxxG_C_C family probable redox protein
MKKTEKALSYFESGLNCSQSVLSVFALELGIDTPTAMKLSSGFGAGMGRLGETCGAVSGAFMAISLKYGNSTAAETDKKEKAYQVIQDFHEKFRQIHHTSRCGELINCDLKTEEGQFFFQKNNLFEEVCMKCIETSVGLLEELLKTE